MFLIIQTTNASFISSDRGREYTDLGEAKAAAVEAALDIVRDETRKGGTANGVEVVIKNLDGRQLVRLAVAASVSPLFISGERQA
jgi:hypothetical protein